MKLLEGMFCQCPGKSRRMLGRGSGMFVLMIAKQGVFLIKTDGLSSYCRSTVPDTCPSTQCQRNDRSILQSSVNILVSHGTVLMIFACVGEKNANRA